MTVSVAHATVKKLTHEEIGAIQEQLKAILESEVFLSSKRCQEFLEFVVQHAVVEDFQTLNERFLGVELFGRAIDYETATDSIVRVRANDVRRRLTQYYARLASPPLVRIEMLAGGYIPEFHFIPEPDSDISLTPPDHSTSPDSTLLSNQFEGVSLRTQPGEVETLYRSGWAGLTARWYFWASAVALVAGLIIAPHTLIHRSNFDRFWQPVVDAVGVPVVDLPTTDTMQLTMDPVRSLKAWNGLNHGESLKIGVGDAVGFHDWHISMPVFQAALSVSLALERKDKVPIVRIGTDMSRDELRGHPVIAIGSFSNPWTQQNVSGLRFTFDRGNSDQEAPRIRDAQNPNRFWSLSQLYPEPQTKDYAIVTRTFDPVTHEPFLSLAGLHSFGNQIAGEFVSQETSWNEVARRGPAGWEKMNMQVLLETNIVGKTPGSPRIIDVYFWK